MYHGIPVLTSHEQLGKTITPQGISILALMEIAAELGLQCFARRGNFEEFKAEADLPCIVFWRKTHFVVVYEITEQTIKMADPAKGLQELSFEAFQANWQTEQNLSGSSRATSQGAGQVMKEGIAVFCRKPSRLP